MKQATRARTLKAAALESSPLADFEKDDVLNRNRLHTTEAQKGEIA